MTRTITCTPTPMPRTTLQLWYQGNLSSGALQPVQPNASASSQRADSPFSPNHLNCRVCMLLVHKNTSSYRGAQHMVWSGCYSQYLQLRVVAHDNPTSLATSAFTSEVQLWPRCWVQHAPKHTVGRDLPKTVKRSTSSEWAKSRFMWGSTRNDRYANVHVLRWNEEYMQEPPNKDI